MLLPLLVVASIVTLAYVGLCATLFTMQRSLLYFPQPRSLDSQFATLTLPTAPEKVLVSVLPRESRYALVYFGGNAEDVTQNMPGLAEAVPTHSIYLMHYRGYCGSSGKPSQKALFADALVLFDQVYASHENVVIVGRSLGSGIAVHLASVRPAARLILGYTAYDSIQELAAAQYPYVPVRWLLLDKFESWRYAPKVSAPTLIIAAEHDELIPRASTELLFHDLLAMGLRVAQGGRPGPVHYDIR